MSERKMIRAWGPGEIRRYYGISPATLHAWRQHPDFPVPAELQMGPLWLAADVDEWVAANRPHRLPRATGGGR